LKIPTFKTKLTLPIYDVFKKTRVAGYLFSQAIKKAGDLLLLSKFGKCLTLRSQNKNRATKAREKS
jgi:hypothetical protein